jgi:hypothetical protein
MNFEYVGLGLTEQQTGGIITSGASAGAGIAAGALLGSVVPGIGTAVGAAVGIIGSLITNAFKPNLYKINASNYANEIESQMQQNLAAWLAIPTNERYASVQAVYVNNFNTLWATYEQDVQQDLAKAPDSITDRQDGSCAYHTAECAGWNGSTYVPNGPNQSTGCCWNWFVGYLDPIANDPNVQADPVGSAVGGAVASLSSATGLSSSMLYLGLGGLALVFALVSMGRHK